MPEGIKDLCACNKGYFTSRPTINIISLRFLTYFSTLSYYLRISKIYLKLTQHPTMEARMASHLLWPRSWAAKSAPWEGRLTERSLVSSICPVMMNFGYLQLAHSPTVRGGSHGITFDMSRILSSKLSTWDSRLTSWREYILPLSRWPGRMLSSTLVTIFMAQMPNIIVVMMKGWT